MLTYNMQVLFSILQNQEYVKFHFLNLKDRLYLEIYIMSSLVIWAFKAPNIPGKDTKFISMLASIPTRPPSSKVPVS